MDARLVELIEDEGDLFGDDAFVWKPVTPDACGEWECDYFIDASTTDHDGCACLGTVVDCREAIEKMNEELTHAA